MGGPQRDFVLDLHNHTHHSHDGAMSPLELLRAAARRGVDCVGVTDHATVRGGLEAARFSAAHPDLPSVITGQEVLTTQGEVIGLYLMDEIPSGLTFDQAVAAIRAQGGLVYLPHPYDATRSAAIRRGVVEHAAGLSDIIEVENGRSLRPRYDRLAMQLAVRHGKAFGAGSDAHYPGELGRAVLEVERPPTGDGLRAGPPARDELLALLRNGRLRRARGARAHVLGWWFLARVGIDKLRRRFIRGPGG
ncbi:MAG: PHP domain-containing protein [Thioalkalivibrio sp.]|nr:PHP domain-containing protein [Thioalkalivibrio sp.]